MGWTIGEHIQYFAFTIFDLQVLKQYMPHKSPLGVGLAFYIPGLLSRVGFGSSRKSSVTKGGRGGW